MTCIVGIVYGNKVYIGGDSAGVGGLDITYRKDKKVFKNGEMIMGFTSSFRMGQLLQYRLEIPYHKPGVSIEDYMHTDFIDAVRKCLKDYGYARNNSGEDQGGFFLLGYRGRLFSIQSDYQICETIDGYDAVGCGEDYAKGSLFETQDLEITPERRIEKALQAAEYFSAGVASPFHIISTEEAKQEVS